MIPTISKDAIQRVQDLVSLQLWELQAIKVNFDQPFRLTSGNYSPIYINCRQAISDRAFMQMFATFAQMLMTYHDANFDYIAGAETAGIPFASYLACGMNRPLLYVRKSTKSHGITSLIEGKFETDSTVILVDDVITDAGTKLNAIQSIRLSGGRVNDVLVVFDREQDGSTQLHREGIRLLSLTRMSAAMDIGRTRGILTSDNIDSLKGYFLDPGSWHQANNLPYKLEKGP